MSEHRVHLFVKITDWLITAITALELPVKITKAKALALIESPMPEWLLIPVKLIRFSIFGFIIWILLLLRQLVRSVAKGDPFNINNGNRLLWIGLSILIIGIFEFFHDILLNIFITPKLSFDSIIPESSFNLSLSLLLVAMIIIVIGEAFRIGAEMKEEQELTV